MQMQTLPTGEVVYSTSSSLPKVHAANTLESQEVMIWQAWVLKQNELIVLLFVLSYICPRGAQLLT
jgi:hypothetical protein